MAKVSFLDQEHVRLINEPETELAFEDNPNKRIGILGGTRSEEHTSEPQALTTISRMPPSA